MDSIVNYSRLKIAIGTGTDKNAIGRVKHHKAGAAKVENGPDVYKKVGKVAKMC